LRKWKCKEGAYDFWGELNKVLKKGCNPISKNKTQSLGDAFVFLEGTK
jgi:hypothetical protein